MDPFDQIPEAPDLSGQVVVQGFKPIFIGPYSCVYKGKLRQNGELVAIKAINAVNGTALHTMQRKLSRERRTWSALDHPNILPLYGFADDNELFEPFGALISPWMQQGDASEFLARYGDSLTHEHRISLWQDVLAGVNYLHSYNPHLVHGDLKPKNILIDNSGNAQICDFGLVRVFLEEGNTGWTTTTNHTGTERYLAHELVVAAEEACPTAASDIWAVGCIGLEFIFSQIPYSTRKGSYGGGIFMDIKKGVPPAECPTNLPHHLQSIWPPLERCWDLDPLERPHAAALAQWLKQQAASSTPSTNEISLSKRPRYPEEGSKELSVGKITRNFTANTVCHHCGRAGHTARNCVQPPTPEDAVDLGVPYPNYPDETPHFPIDRESTKQLPLTQMEGAIVPVDSSDHVTAAFDIDRPSNSRPIAMGHNSELESPSPADDPTKYQATSEDALKVTVATADTTSPQNHTGDGHGAKRIPASLDVAFRTYGQGVAYAESIEADNPPGMPDHFPSRTHAHNSEVTTVASVSTTRPMAMSLPTTFHPANSSSRQQRTSLIHSFTSHRRSAFDLSPPLWHQAQASHSGSTHRQSPELSKTLALSLYLPPEIPSPPAAAARNRFQLSLPFGFHNRSKKPASFASVETAMVVSNGAISDSESLNQTGAHQLAYGYPKSSTSKWRHSSATRDT